MAIREPRFPATQAPSLPSTRGTSGGRWHWARISRGAGALSQRRGGPRQCPVPAVAVGKMISWENHLRRELIDSKHGSEGVLSKQAEVWESKATTAWGPLWPHEDLASVDTCFPSHTGQVGPGREERSKQFMNIHMACPRPPSPNTGHHVQETTLQSEVPKNLLGEGWRGMLGDGR